MKTVISTPRTTTRNASLIAILCRDKKMGNRLRKMLASEKYAIKVFEAGNRFHAWHAQNKVDALVVALHEKETPEAVIAGLRGRFPLLPILAVADGVESQRIKAAIRSGANHFVHDIRDESTLKETIGRLLQFRMDQLRYTQVVPYMRTRLESELPSELHLLGGMVFYLTEEMFKHGIISLNEINAKIALVEALTNAMEHGNKLDPKKKVRIVAEFDQEQAVFTIEDEGEGFNYEEVKDPTDKENLFRPRGRGIFMMRQFMDEVKYFPPGNKVVLVKKRSGEAIMPRPYPWERRGG